MRRAFVLAGSLMVVAMLVGLRGEHAAAQVPTPSDDDVNRIAKQLYCPVCENIPLDVCPTQACEQWRGTIRQKLADGWSDEQIKQYFVDQYGARVLATPPPTGLNWLVYVVPPVAILVGVVVFFRSIRSLDRGAAVVEPPRPTPSEDPYVARLEEELRRRG